MSVDQYHISDGASRVLIVVEGRSRAQAVNVSVPLLNWLANCCSDRGAGPLATDPEVV